MDTFFNSFYGLLQEANFFRSEEEVLREVNGNTDNFIINQLTIIKRYKAKSIASEKKDKVNRLTSIFEALKDDDKNSLISLLGEKYSSQAQALYSNYKHESEKDIESIREEKLRLAIMEILDNEEES